MRRPGERRSRVARLGRWVFGFAVTAALLGVGTPMLAGRPVPTAATLTADADPSAFARAALAASRPSVDLPSPDLPRGYHAPAPPVAPPAAAKPAQPATAAPRPTTAVKSQPPAVTAPQPAPAAAGASLPLAVPTGNSTQVVTVVAPSSGATTATLTAWQKGPGGWTAVIGPTTAHIGAQGVGTASEDRSVTPTGTFGLTEGFGRLANPGTAISYRTIDANSYWVSDAGPRYNQFYECAAAACPSAENLWDARSSYNYAVVIDYNRWPARPGAGSAFFLHVTNGAATAGCVAIPQGSLVTLMRWLSPAAHPLISIGVG